jgi:hypothetical protein
MQDLVHKNGRGLNGIVSKIERAGGIHKYLGFDGNVILSSVMYDKTIYGFTKEMCSQLINTVAPDYYLTPDGETYLGEPHISNSEILRMLAETKFLLAECPGIKPIGLVKGCNLSQVTRHTDALMDLGISMYAFHAGDFISRGSKNSVMYARMFAKQINGKVPWLMIYGVGTHRHFVAFNYANSFVTQSHFIRAFNGKILIDGKWVRVKGSPTRDVIMHNLCSIEEMLISLNANTKLTIWLDEDEMNELDPKAIPLGDENEKAAGVG